jgi:phosphoglycerate dehydrogenase-like enzyme
MTIAVGPSQDRDWLTEAVRQGGGSVAAVDQADALIWSGNASDLSPIVKGHSRLRWIQLPAAGIEPYLPLMADRSRVWTAATGVYAEPVAELALGLAIAGTRRLDAGIRSHQWKQQATSTLYDAQVLIVGGGGIGRELIRLLTPFRAVVTVVRRQAELVEGAHAVVQLDRLQECLPIADLVFVAAPLTPQTEGLIGEKELRAMKDSAWLINVARGKLVRTGDLVRALQEHWIGGAGLDVTDPEPLPADHPLWRLENCIITSHSAGATDHEHRLLERRISENVRRFLSKRPLIGVVDLDRGY